MRSIVRLGLSLLTVVAPMSACGGGGSTGVNPRLIGGTMQGATLKLSGTVTTSAGDGSQSATDCTVGAGAGFDFPEGITTDGAILYIADSGNHTIRKMTIATGAVTTVAGMAYTPGATDCTIGTGARFQFPGGVTTDGTNLYVADTNNHSIRKIVLSTGAVTTIAGDGNVQGYADGVGTAAHFNFPHGITTDGTNLYVADGDNHLIRKIDLSTGVVSTFAGDNVTDPPAPNYSDGTGTAARFAYPSAVTTDGTNLFVTDTDNHLIRKIVIATGAVTTIAGDNASIHWSGAAGPPGGYADGVGSAARFSSPSGITTDGTNLFVSETGNHLVRKVVIATGAVSTVAGDNVTLAPDFADGTGTAAHFAYPIGIVSDGTNLFVSDRNNNRIRKIR